MRTVTELRGVSGRGRGRRIYTDDTCGIGGMWYGINPHAHEKARHGAALGYSECAIASVLVSDTSWSWPPRGCVQ